MLGVQNDRLTISVHASLDALGEATGSALVSVRLVNHAAAFRFRLTGVLAVAPDGALEEASAAVAGVDAVVLARRVVPAHLARYIEEDAA